MKASATPEQIEEVRAATEGLWLAALHLVAEESAHTLSCSEPECGGIIFPWLNDTDNIPDRESAVALLAVVLERLADGAAGLAAFGPPEN